MATKSYQEVKNLSPAERLTKIREIETELFQARIQKATGQLSDFSKPWRLRKNLARLKMLQNMEASQSKKSK